MRFNRPLSPSVSLAEIVLATATITAAGSFASANDAERPVPGASASEPPCATASGACLQAMAHSDAPPRAEAT